MLNGGEDARYIARRLVRFAVEDIGIADPNALTQRWPAGKPTSGWLPGGRTGDRPGGGLFGNGTEIECGLYGVRGGARLGESHRQPDAAGAYSQRATKLMKSLGYGRVTNTITERRMPSPGRIISRTG